MALLNTQGNSKSNVATRAAVSGAGAASAATNCGTSTASDSLRNSKSVSSPEPGRKVTGP